MKKILAILLFGIVAYGLLNQAARLSTGTFFSSESPTGDKALEKAFQDKLSNVEVAGSGKVIRILPDDIQSSWHQRFIVELNSGQTLLIAHNIGIAPRVSNLNVGDRIGFYGVYEWNPEGGVVHWTHHDPSGRHINGWIKHDGKIYQ